MIEMIKRILVFGIVIIFLVSLFSLQNVSSENEITTNPKNIYFTLLQGETKEKEVEIKNEGNKTMKGELSVARIKGPYYPWADISPTKIELKPNETIKVKIKAESKFDTYIGEHKLPIYFLMNENSTIIGTIYIQIVQNYFIYIGIGILLLVIAIIIILFLYKRRKKKGDLRT